MVSDTESSRSSSSSSSKNNTTKPAEPTIEAVQTAAKEALHLDQEVPCKRFSEGTHHAVYAIGDDHVARCLPASEKALKSLRRDAKVQKLARKYMAKPEIVPEVLEIPLVIGEWQGNLERKLHGISLEHSGPTEKTEEDLARLLVDLRKVPVEDAVAATEWQQEKVNLRARVAKTIRAWEDLLEKGHATDPEGKMPIMLKEKLNRMVSFPEPPYTPTFLHADINTENILISPTNGSITGVLDWSDALVGDPCINLSGAVFAIGAAAARRVGRKAGLSEWEVERAVLYTMTEMVRDLRKCLCGEKKDGHLEGLMRGEWERVFEGEDGCGGLLVRMV